MTRYCLESIVIVVEHEACQDFRCPDSTLLEEIRIYPGWERRLSELARNNSCVMSPGSKSDPRRMRETRNLHAGQPLSPQKTQHLRAGAREKCTLVWNPADGDLNDQTRSNGSQGSLRLENMSPKMGLVLRNPR